MSYQTTLDESRRGKKPSPSEGVRQGVSGLLHDAITLAELQCKLLGLDLSETASRAMFPVICLSVGGVLALSTLPLLLVALAQGLRDGFHWPAGLATLAAVGVGLLVAGIAAAIGYVKLRTAFAPLNRSRDELTHNIGWLKESLSRQRSPEVPVHPPVQPR